MPFPGSAIGCVFSPRVLGALLGPVHAHLDAKMTPFYTGLLGILTVLWFIYPILWVLGTEGTGTLDLTGEIIVFAVIDVLAKVGFGIVLVTGPRPDGSRRRVRSGVRPQRVA